MNTFIEKQNIMKVYSKCNKICPFCFSNVTIKDIYSNNYVYSQTKRRKYLAHRICIERNIRP